MRDWLLGAFALCCSCRFDPQLPSGVQPDFSTMVSPLRDLSSSSRDGFLSFVSFPTHARATDVQTGAPNVSGLTAINTDSLTTTPTVNGLSFSLFGSIAVMSVGTLTIDKQVVVSGSHSLIIVASGAVNVAHTIKGGATGTSAGPGGNDPTQSMPGVGADGVDMHSGSPGGGGGGFGTAGAPSAAATAFGPGTVPGAAGGAAYGDASSFFAGGAAGGTGADVASCGSNPMPNGHGGAGGGAIQISSLVSITIATGGGIDVGGGAGQGGCYGSGGGGGGSGGMIYLEAPMIEVDGKLAANGGSGGGAGTGGSVNAAIGTSGSDGALAATSVAGGAAGGTNGGAGGTGGALNSPPGTGDQNGNTGGGGGAVGRIRFRVLTGKSTIAPSAVVSPQNANTEVSAL